MERLKSRSFDEYALLCATPALGIADLFHSGSKGSYASLILGIVFLVVWASLLFGVRYAHIALALAYVAVASYRLHGMLLAGQPWDRRNVVMAFVPLWLGYVSARWRERGPNVMDKKPNTPMRPETSITGEDVQNMVTRFLDRRYPDGWSWLDSKFDCFGDAPLQLKMIPAFQALEYNISNGGWAQFLWNCWGCWPQLLDIVQPGYRLIGAHDQADAIDDLRRLCERDDRECEAAMIRSVKEDHFKHEFELFTSRIITESGNDWQRLFFDDSGVYETRLQWLEDNEALVRQLIVEATA